jgi:serine/threonine protein kinase
LACGDQDFRRREDEGQVLIAGRYRPHTTIGRGAMGEVWRARDEKLGRDVAIKFLLAQGSDATATARFRLEAQTAGRLDHPHVVAVLDFGAHDDRLFLVMELVEGDSLARVLGAAGSLPAERVARIASEAAAGLAAAHRQGIVHRDIKPGNLLLTADGALKIGDFGIARFMDDPAGGLTATGQIIGTSLYLAPERALGRNAGPPSDVYSLGCVLYQLLTGRPPFQADTAVAILHHHLDAAPTPPRQLGVDMPPALENYLLGMLAKQPEARPTAPQVAEWFGIDSWRGRPEPLPPAASWPIGSRTSGPDSPGSKATGPAPQAAVGHPRAGRTSAPRTAAPHQAAPHQAAPHQAARHTGAAHQAAPHTPAEPGPATTYALPNSSGYASPSRRGRGRGGSSLRQLVARSPKLVGTIAAAMLFLAALLIGMALFSQNSDSAQTSGPDSSSSSGSTPAPAGSPHPDSASVGNDNGDGNGDGNSNGDGQTGTKQYDNGSGNGDGGDNGG